MIAANVVLAVLASSWGNEFFVHCPKDWRRFRQRFFRQMVAVLLATGYRFPAARGKFGNGGSASGFFLYLLGLLQFAIVTFTHVITR